MHFILVELLREKTIKLCKKSLKIIDLFGKLIYILNEPPPKSKEKTYREYREGLRASLVQSSGYIGGALQFHLRIVLVLAALAS